MFCPVHWQEPAQAGAFSTAVRRFVSHQLDSPALLCYVVDVTVSGKGSREGGREHTSCAVRPLALAFSHETRSLLLCCKDIVEDCFGRYAPSQ